MVIQHNMQAANANRQLGTIVSNQSKATEKLSSGYRINRAGDDAAGLKISEKMRSQVRGLNRASTNAQDGVSLIQTAEGALNEAHSILQRMNELAVQGANDTNENIDREAINEELDALTTELDRISSTTQFNKQNLLDGSFKNKKLQVGANADQNIEISIGSMNAKTLGLKDVSGTIEKTAQEGVNPVAIKYQGMSYTYRPKSSLDKNTANAISVFKKQLSGKYTAANYAAQFENGKVFYKSLVNDKTYDSVSKVVSADIAAAQKAMSADVKKNINTYLQTSAVTAKALSSYTQKGNARVDTYEMANNSITAIQDAINKVSSQRSALGALQNRLEHTIANLDNVAENTQAAESRIRDTDMASEMVKYSNNNILAQAGQAMLAQSNQSNQGVLSLLS